MRKKSMIKVCVKFGLQEETLVVIDALRLDSARSQDSALLCRSDWKEIYRQRATAATLAAAGPKSLWGKYHVQANATPLQQWHELFDHELQLEDTKPLLRRMYSEKSPLLNYLMHIRRESEDVFELSGIAKRAITTNLVGVLQPHFH